MPHRGPKVKFSRTRDAAALFMYLRPALGYRPALRDVSALLGVPERNIERECQPTATFIAPTFVEPLALCAVAANRNLIRANLGERAVDGVAEWPGPVGAAVAQLLPGR